MPVSSEVVVVVVSLPVAVAVVVEVVSGATVRSEENH